MRPKPELMWNFGLRCFWPEFNTLRDCSLCIRIAERDVTPGQEYLYILSEAPEAEQYRGDCITSLEEAVEKVTG